MTGGNRHGRLRPGALRSAPDPVRLGHESPAPGRDPARQRRLRGDHGRAGGRPGAADRRLRAGGLFISVFYVAPPIRLKYHGLGEPGVFLVWGPLMVGGTFLAASRHGRLVGPAGIGAVRADRHGGPVREAHRQDRGGRQARRPDAAGDPRRGPCAAWWAAGLMILFYPLTLLAVRCGLLGPVGRCWWRSGSRACVQVLSGVRRPKPAGPPPGYPERGWPLWFVGYAFIHTRRAGGLLTLGLLLNALLPVTLPWLVGRPVSCPAMTRRGQELEQVELGDDADRATLADREQGRRSAGQLGERLGEERVGVDDRERVGPSPRRPSARPPRGRGTPDRAGPSRRSPRRSRRGRCRRAPRTPASG